MNNLIIFSNLNLSRQTEQSQYTE
uniref:Uncharacterized protein n=1 Tax=Arundo donax TaxID=35708 RepID=A0A0A8YSQ9_ARUDO